MHCERPAMPPHPLPFHPALLLLMAALVAAYSAGLLPLGSQGWLGLAGMALLGNAILWWGSERLWGRFSP